MFSPMASIDEHDLFGHGRSAILPNIHTDSTYIRFVMQRNLACQPELMVHCHSKTENEPKIKQKTIIEYGLSTYKTSFALKKGIIKQRVEDRLNSEVTIDLDNSAIVFKCAESSSINDLNTFEENVVEILLEIDNELFYLKASFQLDTFEFTKKHMNYYISKIDNIGAYEEEGKSELHFVFLVENQQQIIKHHIDLVQSQIVKSKHYTLSERDKIIINANKSKLIAFPVNIILLEDTICLSGITEDLLNAEHKMNFLLAMRAADTRCLNENEVKIIKNVGYINQRLNDDKLSDVKWKINGNLLEIEGANKKVVARALGVIVNSCQYLTCELQWHLMDSCMWDEFKNTLDNRYPDMVVIDESETPRIKIFTVQSYFKQVEKEFEDVKERYDIKRIIVPHQLSRQKFLFISKHLKFDLERDLKDEFLRLDMNNDDCLVTVVGTETGYLAASIYFDGITSKRFGIRESKISILEILERGVDLKEPTCTIQVKENRTRLQVKQGRIENEKLDVIVDSIARNKDPLNHGMQTIAGSIFCAGGSDVRDCLHNNSCNLPIPFGDIIVGDPGDNPCKKIYHIAFSPYIPTLRNAVRSCLERASGSSFESISFPALCTGILGYPVDLVAKTIIGTIVEYINTEMTTSLSQINVVHLGDGRPICEALNRECGKRIKKLRKLYGPPAEGREMLLTAAPWVCNHYCNVTVKTERDIWCVKDKLEEEIRHQTIAMTVAGPSSG